MEAVIQEQITAEVQMELQKQKAVPMRAVTGIIQETSQLYQEEDGSGTRGAFVELFGIEEEVNGEKVDMTTEEANITNSTSVMMSTVAQDEYAIGYISLGSLDDSVKAVKVDGSEATAENIKNWKL